MTWRSDAVEVERVGLQFEVEALGQHDLEDVAGEDVLAGHRHRGGVQLGRGAPRGRGQLVVAVGGHDDRLVYGLGPLGGELLQPLERPVVEVVSSAVVAPAGTGTASTSVTRWRQAS